MNKIRKHVEEHPRLALIVLGAVLMLSIIFLVPRAAGTVYERGAPLPVAKEEKPERKISSEGHIPTPTPLKGIYMSQCVVGTPSFRAKLVQLVDETDLNAIVIDIKDFSGTIGFPIAEGELGEASMVSCGAKDMKEFVKMLHDKNIYVIGRITVFQDPYYTKKHPEQAVQSKSNPGVPWKDHKGLAFVDVSSRPYWEYIKELSILSYEMGFDELNYDYVRYPSDGNMSDAAYKNPNKADAVELFWKYLHDEVKPIGVVISADLFGMTTSNTDDLGIGQQLEKALPYFDYIYPMVYPSHYPDGFLGLTDPNSDPYKVIHYAMTEAVKRTKATETPVKTIGSIQVMRTETIPATETTPATTRTVATGMYTKQAYSVEKIRPWLQDFDYGKEYTPADINAQNQATYDAGLTSWIYWDPSNRYDSLSQALRR